MKSSKVTVYYTARNYGYASNVESIEFSTKENADAFINIMKAEGYEITQFGGEGYLGAEAEQEKLDAEVRAEVEEAVDGFILNNYGFLKGQPEYGYIETCISNVMEAYGFNDEPRSFINFLAYPQFKEELNDSIANNLEWYCEMGGIEINPFANR